MKTQGSTRDRLIWIFGADTDILVIHGPIFPKFLNLAFCFIIKNIKYSMP